MIITREEDLIDDDIVDIDVVFSEFLDKSVGFVHREEFRDANSNKSSSILYQTIRIFRIFQRITGSFICSLTFSAVALSFSILPKILSKASVELPPSNPEN